MRVVYSFEMDILEPILETWIVGSWELGRNFVFAGIVFGRLFGWIRGSRNMGSKTCLPMAWYKI